MRYGIYLAILGPYAEPGLAVEVARACRAAAPRWWPARSPRWTG
jgi:hypothetical protein